MNRNRRDVLRAATLLGAGAIGVNQFSSKTLAANDWSASKATVSNSFGDITDIQITEENLTFNFDWSGLSNTDHSVDFTLKAKLSSASAYETLFTDSFTVSGGSGSVSESKLDSSNFPVSLFSQTSMSAGDFSSDNDTKTTPVDLKVVFATEGETASAETSFDTDVTEIADGPTSGLIAHYPFNGDAEDKTGNGYNGTVTGATYNGSGQVGSNSLSFDGTDDHVQSSGIQSSTVTGWSVSVWFKSSNPNSVQRLAIEFDGSAGGYYARVDSDDTCFYANNDGNTGTNVSATVPVTDGNWHHFVGVFNGDSTSQKLYIDGTLEGENTNANSQMTTSGTDLGIGAFPDGSHALNGSLDDVRIYDRALSSTEVQNLYDATK